MILNEFLRKIIYVWLIFNTSVIFAQNRGNVWCFGHNASINFNSGIPVSDSSRSISRGSCASICDQAGNLQFYVSGDTVALYAATLRGGKIYNKIHQLMSGGDSIVTRAWYNEEVLVPNPNDTNLFYVFTVGVTSIYGLYYSVVELIQNGGLGAVTQKNIQLQNFPNVDCLNAIKHGNGRDWWVFFRRWDPITPTPINEFHSYLITPAGITNYSIQQVGSGSYTGLGKISFSASGDKMAFVTYAGLIEIFDFDRCSGTISNPINLYQETLGPANHFWGCEFSPSGNLLYVTISDQTSYLFQFDLTAPNITASIDTLWQTSFPGEAIGALKRGPDGKIYQSGPYTNPAYFAYPYPDSVYNMYNMNLGVINSPDSLGAACDFQPYSFYLGGKRTYWGLPNNPDYDMPALAGSPCDSLTAIEEITQHPISELHIYYNSSWQTAFINADKLKGNQYSLRVYDLMGKEVFRESGRINTPYFTKKLNCQAFAMGMYIVSFKTDYEQLTSRFVVE